MARIIDVHATDETTRLELEIGRENPEQLQAITRYIGVEIDSIQATILHQVIGNKVGRKVKSKAKTHHGSKKQTSSITALKMIVK